MQKSLELVGVGKTLPLVRGTRLHIRQKIFHLDHLIDGGWRLTYTASLIPAEEVLTGMTIVVAAGGKSAEGEFQYKGHPSLKMQITKIAPMSLPKGVKAQEIPAPQMLHFEQHEDGTWRLLYSRDLISDIKQLRELKVHREGSAS